MLCQGCGEKMEYYALHNSLDSFSEFCGSCNRKYCEQRELEETINQKLKSDKFEAMVKKYGYENACEILADGMY